MAADSGHSSDVRDAHPDLESDPDPGPAVGVVEHLDAAKCRQRHTKVPVNCLGLLCSRKVEHQFAAFHLQFCHVRLLASGGSSVWRNFPLQYGEVARNLTDP
jgi:hypothetical protein